MRRMARLGPGAGVVVLAAVGIALAVPAAAQVNLGGRWELNRELSDNPQERMQAFGGRQGRGDLAGVLAGIDPARLAELRGRGGGGRGDLSQLGGLLGQLENLRGMLEMPDALVLVQDAEVLSITQPDGQVRRVPVEPGASMVNGREVHTRWDEGRLVSETLLSETMTLVETFERSESGQLVMTTSLDLQGQPVQMRRVYDPVRGD